MRNNEPTIELFSHWCSMEDNAQWSNSPRTSAGEGWVQN
jgi:hypothetical protein